MSLTLGRDALSDLDGAMRREWLVTNGLGGFACGSVAGANTRRYHGLLVAALRPPLDRTLMVAKLDVVATYRGSRFELATNEYADGTIAPRGYVLLECVPPRRHDPGVGLADRRCDRRAAHLDGAWVEHDVRAVLCRARKRARAARSHSALHVPGLSLAPSRSSRDARDAAGQRRSGRLPTSELSLIDCSRTAALACLRRTGIGTSSIAPKAERGLDDVEDLFRPATFTMTLAAGETGTMTLTASDAEPLPGMQALEQERARQAALLQLAPAAIETLQPARPRRRSVHRRTAHDDSDRQHGNRRLPLVRRLGPRHDDRAARPHLDDWPPGDRREHSANVRAFVSDGLLPNRFPDGAEAPEYNTVDATLWYFVRDRRVRARQRRSQAARRAVSGAALDRALASARHAARHSVSTIATDCCAPARPACSSPGWTRRSATGS